MRIYDHLFFDLDNTLWDFKANSRQAMAQTIEQKKLLGKLPSFDEFFEVYEGINHSLWNDYHQKKITKQKLMVERFSQSLKQFGIDNFDWSELNHEYLENMARQTRLFPQTIETLAVLQSKGYKMYIITNGFREVQHKKLENCGIGHFFTKVFISEDIQSIKPHRQIFEYAIKSSNALKKKSIMIGDSWEIDIQGALEFGMDQVMFLNHDSNSVPGSIQSIINTTTAPFIELKPKVKTYFIYELIELSRFL